MKLWTEILPPAEQTVYARQSLQQREEAKGSLAAFLPTQPVDDITLRFDRTRMGMVPTAEYRSYDTETTIGALPGGERVTIDLPPLGQKVRVGELDQLRARGGATIAGQENLIAAATDRVVTAVSDRLEYARGRVIETGKLSINENGFKVEHDLGRSQDMVVTAATKWNQDGADPLEDMQAWAEAYEDENGQAPGALVVSPKIRSTLRKSEAFRKMVGGVASTPNAVSLDFINTQLQSEGLPALQVFSRRVNVAGEVQRVLDEKKAFFLPAAGSNILGGTFMGTTLESAEPEYGIAPGDRAGIVVGTFRDNDPVATWVHASAIGMPALVNPNAAMVAEVL